MSRESAAVALGAFLSGLHGGWLDDDPLAITNNADVHCDGGVSHLLDNTPTLWANDFWGTPVASNASHLSYRPLTILSFRLQHCLVGLHGPAFHGVNVALHALVWVSLVPWVPPVFGRWFRSNLVRTQR